MHSEATVSGRLRDELWRKCLNAIGLRVVFKSDKKTEIIKASRLGKVQMFESNWIADFPDGDNFYQLLYGPNAGRANYARFNLPAYNERYEQARSCRTARTPEAVFRDEPADPRLQPVGAADPCAVGRYPPTVAEKLQTPPGGIHVSGAIWTSMLRKEYALPKGNESFRRFSLVKHSAKLYSAPDFSLERANSSAYSRN
jgi:hypothetical protein